MTDAAPEAPLPPAGAEGGATGEPAPARQPANAEGGLDITAGSGPRAFNITNTNDHAITLGQFDQQENLVAEMTLEPGQSGQMRYENDTTGLVKQADADGNYQPDASRLEFYNGFVNTSDIAGRNASIYARDENGFEIGDRQSIGDGAPAGAVDVDSAGRKTIAGWYDGSTEKMDAGGAYMTDKLGTGMTYMHPKDDQLGEGQNPMRKTESMTLDVEFGAT